MKNSTQQPLKEIYRLIKLILEGKSIWHKCVKSSVRRMTLLMVTSLLLDIVGHPEPEKKILLAFLSTFWHPCSKCILVCFKKGWGGCQVWKRPKVPELGQRSSECKFLYIRQILAFLSISYPKL